MDKAPKYKNIDEYIQGFPIEVQKILEELRATIKKAAPDATEKIGYQMPAFYQNGNLVYFAARNKHIGFYPTGSGMAAFAKELASYPTSKGAVRFPIDQPLPLELIAKIVRFRVEQTSKKLK